MSSLAEHYKEGGFMMHFILMFLVIAVGIIVERTVYLYRSSINKDVFLASMQKCILAGDIERAIKLCSAARAPLARIVKAGLMRVNRPDAQVQAAMDEEALRELPKVEKRTPYLALLSNLTMLSGLLGTVIGLIIAFAGVAGADSSSKATMLAKGISEAMNCTAFGLLSALTALIGFALLNGKTQGMIDDINGATVQVMNLVVNNRSKVNIQGGAPAPGAMTPQMTMH